LGSGYSAMPSAPQNDRLFIPFLTQAIHRTIRNADRIAGRNEGVIVQRISISKVYRQRLRLYRSLTKNLQAKIKKYFRQQTRKFANDYKLRQAISEDFIPEFAVGLSTILSNHIRMTVNNADSAIQRIRTKLEDTELIAITDQYLAGTTAMHVTQISETTRALIVAEVARLKDKGFTLDQITKGILNTAGGGAFSIARANMIARTETHQALNYANHEISKKLGLEKKQWQNVGDLRVRDWHRSSFVQGQTQNIEDPFIVPAPVAGGTIINDQLMFCGDPNGLPANVINCRCFTVEFAKDDVIEK